MHFASFVASLVASLVANTVRSSQVADCFDIIGGTSTGAIIGFLIGLKRIPTDEAAVMYDSLISRIFVKPKFSTIKTAVTTAQYSSRPFQKILLDILGEGSMASSRADPDVPLVFAGEAARMLGIANVRRRF